MFGDLGIVLFSVVYRNAQNRIVNVTYFGVENHNLSTY